MFNLGPVEILLVFGIGLVVLGPRRLPEVAQYLGKFYAMIRKTTWELRQTLDAEILEEDRRDRREQAEARRDEFRKKRAVERADAPPPEPRDFGPTVAPESESEAESESGPDEAPPADAAPPAEPTPSEDPEASDEEMSAPPAEPSEGPT
jgi:Tat protein translocase TatB subunit